MSETEKSEQNARPCRCPVDARIDRARRVQTDEGAQEILTFICPKCRQSWEESFPAEG